MKRSGAPIIFLCFGLSVANGQAPGVKLTGLIEVPPLKCAVLEFQAEVPYLRAATLSEGDRRDGVTVTSIDEASEGVAVEYQGTTNWLRLDPTEAAPSTRDRANATSPTVLLRSADFRSISVLYGKLKGRTILVHPELRFRKFSTTATAANASELTEVLEKMFHQDGLATIPDGTNFVMLVPNALTNLVHPRPAEIHPLARKTAPSTPEEKIETGTMNFPDTDAFDVLRIYQMLTTRTFVYQHHMEGTTNFIDTRISGNIYFVNASPLSTDEAIYALETMFDWNGIKIIPIDDRSFRIEMVPYLKRWR